jgi:xylan 1,4-beta-xylosidase
VLPGAVRLPGPATVHDFASVLPPEFQWLRTPYPERIFQMTGTALRLTGRESLGSWFEQALVARRQEDQAYHAETTVHADPPNWQRAAGLTTYYNRHKFHAALITHEPGLGRCARIVSCVGDVTEALTFSDPVAVPDGPVTLSVTVDRSVQQFHWAAGGAAQPLGPQLDASVISDEGGRGEHASFTGAFVGMVAHDLTGQGWSADFTRFAYVPDKA